MMGLMTVIDASRPDAAVAFETTLWRGTPYLRVQDGWRSTRYFAGDMTEVVEIDADRWRSLGSAAAWGVLGGLATGGLGLIVGAAVGGRRRQRAAFAITFADGHHAVVETTDRAAIDWLRRVALAHKARDSRKG